MFGAFDGCDDVERSRRQSRFLRVAENEIEARVAGCGQFGVAVLFFRDCDPGYVGTDIAVPQDRGGTVTAAQIANAISGFERSLPGDESSQIGDCLVGRFFSRNPVAMMEVDSPQAAIEIIEIVVVRRNGGNVGDPGARNNHGRYPNGSSLTAPRQAKGVSGGEEPSRKDNVLNLRCTLASPVEFLDETRSEEHTSELQSQANLVCRLLLEKKK